jgi:hypothetical protein
MKQSGHQPLDKSQEEFFAGGELSAAGRFRTGKRDGKWKYYHCDGRANGHRQLGKFNGLTP